MTSRLYLPHGMLLLRLVSDHSFLHLLVFNLLKFPPVPLLNAHQSNRSMRNHHRSVAALRAQAQSRINWRVLIGELPLRNLLPPSESGSKNTYQGALQEDEEVVVVAAVHFRLRTSGCRRQLGRQASPVRVHMCSFQQRSAKEREGQRRSSQWWVKWRRMGLMIGVWRTSCLILSPRLSLHPTRLLSHKVATMTGLKQQQQLRQHRPTASTTVTVPAASFAILQGYRHLKRRPLRWTSDR
ncbi:MAG: hypothetical protein JOS17DRAFT_726812 [Linnemannia elongata]|nr:MAG: hypothetical protein JOS17DRAFT_726812 [Linnemannia elongata]